MTYEEFVVWTQTLVERGRLTPEQADDLCLQRRLFDDARDGLEREFAGRAVGFVDQQLLVRLDVAQLLDAAADQYHGERQLYFEAIAHSMSAGHSQ
jgi:hypothetical protein